MSQAWRDGFWLGLYQVGYVVSVLSVGAQIGLCWQGHEAFSWEMSLVWLFNLVTFRHLIKVQNERNSLHALTDGVGR